MTSQWLPVHGSMEGTAVLLLYFGAPRTPAGAPAFLREVTSQPNLPADAATALIERYRAIGGSPLPSAVEELRVALAAELARRGLSMPVAAAALHGEDHIDEELRRLRTIGSRRVVAVVLTPQYSPAIHGNYWAALEPAAASLGLAVSCVRDWSDNPSLISGLVERLAAALPELRADWQVVFTAHSLPQAHLQVADPFLGNLKLTAALVAERLCIERYSLAFQSAGRRGGDWLGPSVEQTLDRLATEGVNKVCLAPIQFVLENLETLHDLDIEARGLASRLDMQWRRSATVGVGPWLLAALADEVTVQLARCS